jgi:hypothetical protein
MKKDSWRLVGTPLGVDRWRTDLETETVLEGASQFNLLEVSGSARGIPQEIDAG